MNDILEALANPSIAVGGILIVLAALAFVLRMHAFEKRIVALLALHHETRQDRDREQKGKGRRDELAQLKSELHNDLESLRSITRSIAADTQRLLARANSQPPSSRETSAPPPRPSATVQSYDTYEEPRAEDGVAQLLAIANRIVQQSSTTLDAFRASTGGLAANVSAWPNATENVPTAFIVEHRGAHYAIPNVVKPARLPKEWFNRSEFGVNDEIQRIASLPRLRPRGNDYDVQEPGVFSR